MTAEWQKGYDLSRLKTFAQLFKDCHKPFVFGAFGLVKERDIATALAGQDMIFSQGEDPEAAIIFSLLQSGSSHKDFAQREIKIPRGTLLIKSFATRNQTEGRRVLQILLERAERSDIQSFWAEVFEEDEKARSVVESLGFKYVATKVTASSDLKGLYARGGVPGVESLPKLEIPSIVATKALALSVAQKTAIMRELEEYIAVVAARGWEQHYSSYNKGRSWTAFSLRGFDPEPGFIIKPSEMSRQWKEENARYMTAQCSETRAAEWFPNTLRTIERLLPQPKERVRFMKLAAGGELTRHADITDRFAGTKDGMIMRMHIPLETNPMCLFGTWGLRGEVFSTHMRERGLYYLDTRKPHAVKNGGETDRIHLVIDTVADQALRERLVPVA